ncbi:Protein T24B8.2 [Aphelenchoides avenae]|nr:Protein T24B8.2 [Aphelenchus avenae]
MKGSRPPYLPEIWDSDEAMCGLMSLPKARQVNPTNYDRVMRFWQEVIADYCRYEKKCVVSLRELKDKFRRGHLLPSPLQAAIEDMHRSQLIRTSEEIQQRNQGWMQWGASFFKPTSWISTIQGDLSSARLVHVPTMKALADELLDFYRRHYELADCPEVVDYEELRERSSHIVSPESFDLVVDELVYRGEASVGSTKNGEKVLKFKDQGSRGPARFTEADASVHEIRRALQKLENEIEKLQVRQKNYKEQARLALRSGDKSAAMRHMRASKRSEKEIIDKDNQCQRLLGMLQSLVQTKETRELLDVYRDSSRAFKESLKRQGLDIKNVDETMDSVHDAMDDYREIEETIRDGMANLSGATAEDMSALESELNELIAQDKEAAAAGNRVKIGGKVVDLGELPEVPAGVPQSSKAAAAAEQNGDGAATRRSIEDRLKRLRAVAQ